MSAGTPRQRRTLHTIPGGYLLILRKFLLTNDKSRYIMGAIHLPHRRLFHANQTPLRHRLSLGGPDRRRTASGAGLLDAGGCLLVRPAPLVDSRRTERHSGRVLSLPDSHRPGPGRSGPASAPHSPGAGIFAGQRPEHPPPDLSLRGRQPDLLPLRLSVPAAALRHPDHGLSLPGHRGGRQRDGRRHPAAGKKTISPYRSWVWLFM